MGPRPRLRDGAPGPGYADYANFDRQLLPIAVELAPTTASAFIAAARVVYDVHEWTVSRWLWSCDARGLIERTDPTYGGFRVNHAVAARRLSDLGAPT